MEAYWDKIITGLIGLLGVIIGFFLQQISLILQEQDKRKKEFEEIKQTIAATTITNNLSSSLLQAKRFFIRNPAYLRKKENGDFFNNWLLEPMVEEESRAAGYWTKEKIRQLYIDLSKTKL